jgi:carbonic anhydrase
MPEPGAFDELLESNRQYARAFDRGSMAAPARAGVAVVTCMDSRIDPLPMLGLDLNDAKVIRNPGGRVTDAVLEALVLAVHLLEVKRIAIVPHTRCAMASASEEELRERVATSAGQPADWQRFHVVPDQQRALTEDVSRVSTHPLIGERVAVGGFLYDVDTGSLEHLV